ncbi:MAG: hypothetical protein EG822_14185 [Deltaproteobacteria bacterium]|nr:hypothetical protein [Deltaproteobacteria bacterium]TLN03584.1 MAG: hypothetical protein FDZ73_06790 [bacterium]
MRRILSFVSWGYLFSVVVFWLFMFFAGDRWWPATLFLFGPRWFAVLPLVVLIPLVLYKNARLLFPLLAAAAIVFGPFMGLRIPALGVRPLSGPVLRVLTCNIHSGSFNAQKLSLLIRDSRADIVALQECPRNPSFEVPAGWQCVSEGGLMILSRFPMKFGITNQSFHPPHKWPRTSLLHCVVKAPGGDLSFCTVHLPSPRYGLQAILDRKTLLSPSRRGLLGSETSHRLQTSHEVSSVLSALAGPVIVAGDFNLPVDSTIYRETWSRYTNAFSAAGSGYGWTVWGGPRGFEFGARIDHVLVGAGLDVLLCETGFDVGSDHLPLIADIGVKGNQGKCQKH